MRRFPLTLPVERIVPDTRSYALAAGALLLLLLLAGCGPANPEESTATAAPPATQAPQDEEAPPDASDDNGVAANEDGAEAYPGPGSEAAYPGDAPAEAADEDGYPGPPEVRRAAEIQSEPPDPERDLPDASSGLATVGGVLVEEIIDHGFVPLMPRELTLGSIVETTEGEPAFLSTGSAAPKAQLFPTGVFVFRNIEPGSYGLIVDVGHTEFPVRDDEGNLLIFEVEAGDVQDLGQIITPLPN